MTKEIEQAITKLIEQEDEPDFDLTVPEPIPTTEPITWGFSDLRNAVRSGREGLIMLGTGGRLSDWVRGITRVLASEGIAPSEDPKEVWGTIAVLKTTGGRTDLAFMFKESSDLDIGRMAMWRLRYGDNSWASDYIDNYASQHEKIEQVISNIIEQEFEGEMPVEEPRGQEQYEQLAGQLRTLGDTATSVANTIPSTLPPLELLNVRKKVSEFQDYLTLLRDEFDTI